jgi:hypothetical protein
VAAANASARCQRVAILARPLHELTGFYLAGDYPTSGRNGERSFAVAELASFYGQRGGYLNRVQMVASGRPERIIGSTLANRRCSGSSRARNCWPFASDCVSTDPCEAA